MRPFEGETDASPPPFAETAAMAIEGH